MATYKPRTAFNKATSYLKSMPLTQIQLPLLDQINNMMWMAAPWRWTIGSLPTVTLLSDTQDYTIALPSDYLYTTDAYLADGDNQFDTLLVEPALPADVTVVGRPKRISVTGAPSTAGVLRTATKTGTLTSPPEIISMYKKQAPALTLATSNTAGILLFPDEWAWVYEEGVLWQAYLWGDDPRAGSISATSEGQIQYTGQRACFEAALIEMRNREKLPEPDPVAKRELRPTRG